MKISLATAAILMMVCQSCVITPERMEQKSLDPARAAAFASGDSIRLYTLSNANGMTVELSNYGATIVAIHVPDKDGHVENVTLGYDDHAGLAGGKSYFGCVVGRFANRIAHARFVIDGKTYQVPQNDGLNSLHGGVNSIDKKVWTARVMNEAIRFTRTMEDGENGYPGKMQVTVVYSLREDNSLVIDYTATTDQPTVLNLTNHAYFNLTGNPEKTILDHQMMINAGSITPVDSTLIPTGQLKAVAGTPFDFTRPMAIGLRIGADDEQLIFGKGYDHNFVLDKINPDAPAAVVTEPSSGRMMEVFTTEPGIQFYTGNFLNGTEKGRSTSFQYRTGFCLETQHFPDSPNQPAFPSTLLKPGETYKSQTSYRFSIMK